MIYKEFENIPSDWKMVRLSDIAKINPSKPKTITINGINREIKEEDKVSFLGMEDVSENAKIMNNHSKEYKEVSKGYTPFKERDILIAKITPCFENGKGALAQNLTNGIGFGSTEFHVLRAKEKINEKWLYYFTNTYFFRKRGELIMQGSAGQQRVPTNFIKTYHIPKPPRDEQDRIVGILSTWDHSISTLEQLIEAKKRYKKGLMQQLLTGQKRFPEFEGEPWGEVRLGDVFKERKETGYSEYDLLAITTENGVVDRDTLDRRDTSSDTKNHYKRILPGDIGYNTMRMWQGVSGYSELKGIVSPAYTIVTPKVEKVDGRFMSYLFKYPPVVDLFRRYSQGLVDDTLNLKFKNFAEIKVNVPQNLDEQKKIANLLLTQDREIQLLEEQRETYKKQKKGLMQQLLTGKTRMNNIAEEVRHG